ncbi:Ig-like domain-containing protein [Blautia sp. HCP28S3_G10]|uniref:Ig-like domain-containing protein n=1 Tax=Blautia sp. HCP28S3_G10 TaxID=3438908 RepID=UPI003F8A2830
MKKKHLALILAAAMTVTSVDATALVSAADFSAEETAVQAEEETIAAEETEEVAKDASEEEVQAEAEDGEDLTAETEITEDAEEVTAQEEDSEDADLFSGEEETEAVGADTNVSALTLGETKTVSIAENGSVWLSFTPETDGDYVFVSSNNEDSDPYAELYESMDEDYSDSDDDTGEGLNFLLRYSMIGKKTYYLKVSNMGDDACSYDVTVSKAVCISSVILEKGTARTIYYSGGFDDYDGINVRGAKLTVKYDNNTSQVYDLSNTFMTDIYGNTFSIRCTDGKEDYYFGGENAFRNGTYRVYVGGYPNSGYNITVVTPDYSKISNVKTGENTVGIKYGEYVWYKYVPEDTSCYYISAFYSADNTGYGISTIVKTITGDGKLVSHSYWLDGNNSFEETGYQLLKGKTYLIGVNNDEVSKQTTATLGIIRAELTGCKWKTTSTKNATCGTAGQKVEACSTHAGETRTTVIPAAGKHTYSWKVTKPATVFAAGVNSNVCSVCGKVAATKAIAKLSPKLTMSVAAKKTVPLKVKQSYAVKTVDIANGDKIVSWTSSNKKVVTVKNGKITGKKKGTAKITVKLASGYTTWFKVKVQAPVVKTTSLKVTDKATGAKVGKKVTLSRKAKLSLSTVVAPVTSKQKVTYSTSNKKVAAVSSKGVITAKKKGTATITVKSGSKSVKIKVKVK